MITAVGNSSLKGFVSALTQKDFKPIKTFSGTAERKTVKDSNAVITRYTFSKPVSSPFGAITGAEIVTKGNYEYFNAYTSNFDTISCIASKDGKIFLKDCSNAKDFDCSDFMDVMNCVAARMSKVNKEVNSINKAANLKNISANLQTAIDSELQPAFNDTEKYASIRSVLVKGADGTKVNYYTVRPDGKFTASKMLIAPDGPNPSAKRVTFLMPKIDGEKDFFYEFEMIGNKPNPGKKVKVYFNRDQQVREERSCGGVSVAGYKTVSTPDYKFRRAEIDNIEKLILSIQSSENRKEYKDILEIIKNGVMSLTPSV